MATRGARRREFRENEGVTPPVGFAVSIDRIGRSKVAIVIGLAVGSIAATVGLMDAIDGGIVALFTSILFYVAVGTARRQHGMRLGASGDADTSDD